jgi:hypothetical protein
MTQPLVHQPTDPRPVNPNGRNIRAAAHAAGLEHLIERVSTGRNLTYVWLKLDGTPEQGEMLAAVLRPLWNDGKTRVTVSDISGAVFVSREDWHRTRPAARQAIELTPHNVRLSARTDGGWTVLEPGTFAVLGWVSKTESGRMWEALVPSVGPRGIVVGTATRRRDAIQAVIDNRR